jgi:arylsulfatase A
VDVLNIDTPYNEFASSFIKENAANDKPFFLYFGSHHTHAPQFAGDDLLNATARGLFGDSQAEFDRSVGVLIQAVKAAGIADSTAIFVSADNGPSKHWFQLGGSAGQYKCGKGTTYEGGLRVPTVFWAPGVVQNPGGSAEALTAMVDFFPTILGWAGVAKPSNLTIDGVDISSVLSSPLLPPPGRQQQKRREQTVTTNAEGATGPYDPYGPYLPPAQTGPREAVYMWRGNTLMAVRAGNFKAHWWTRGWVGDQFSFPQNPECYADLVQHDPPLLFDVANDAAEFYPLNATDPSYAPIVAQLTQLKLKQEADVVLAPSQTDLGSNADRFPCCNPTCTPRPFCCKCE